MTITHIGGFELDKVRQAAYKGKFYMSDFIRGMLAGIPIGMVVMFIIAILCWPKQRRRQ